MTAGLETFAKVRALHDRTTNAGEKASAAARMKTLAAKAGMTVAQAMSRLDTPPAPAAPHNFFEELFNSPEFRARDAERQRERAERRAAALFEHGSEDAVFADTPMEAALRASCEPLLGTGRTWNDAYKLAGWDWFSGSGKMPAVLRDAVTLAWQMPTTVVEAWAEHQERERREDQRYAFCPEYTPHTFVEARRCIVEEVLNTHPARSLADLRARLAWFDDLNELGSPCQSEQRKRLATLRADIERMGQRIREQDAETSPVQSGHGQEQARSAPHSPAPPGTSAEISGGRPASVQSGHPRRTNSDKRRDVLALLGQGLTDREIARRVGVSPTTVGAIRRGRA